MPAYVAETVMPFTFAHPALILPVICSLPLIHFSTELVVGSLSPDFEYFLSFRLRSLGAHSIPGLFWFCFPVSAVIGFLWYSLVSRSVLFHSPAILRERFARVAAQNSVNLRSIILFLTGALVGAASHILWDSFTHSSGFFVQKFSLLQQQHFGIPIYKALQHSSTVVGLTAIMLCIYKLPRSDSPGQFTPGFWLSLLCLTALAFITIWILSPISFSAGVLGHHVVRIISSGFIALICTSLLYGRHFA